MMMKMPTIPVDFIASVNGLILTKDINSRYTSISDCFARMTGWKDARECIGNTDYDIPSDVSVHADDFVKFDQIVLNGEKSLRSISIQHFTTGFDVLMGERVPLFNEANDITGIMGTGVKLTRSSLWYAFVALQEQDKLLQKSKTGFVYLVEDVALPFPLTTRQHECLFLLLRGKRVKEIAAILDISSRTVEEHLALVKEKLGCLTRSQLIEKAIQSGYLYFIPPSLCDSTLASKIKL